MKSAASLVLAGIAALFLPACETSAPSGGTAVLPPYEVRPAGVPQPALQQPLPLPPAMSPSTIANGAPQILAQSYIMIDPNTGRVLAARNADTMRQVASTQKILTALVLLDDGNLDRPVRIAASDVAVEPTKLGIRPGEVYSRRELISAFLIKSANDVANALARDCAGSTGAFAARMNAKARSLGAFNSYFANPHGLSGGGQHSTARDMARIAMAAYHNGLLRDIVRQKYHAFRYASGRTVVLENTNELLGHMAECDGMKTGYTGPAGRCLISTGHRWGHEVLLVQLGSKTRYIFNDAATMMRWGMGR